MTDIDVWTWVISLTAIALSIASIVLTIATERRRKR